MNEKRRATQVLRILKQTIELPTRTKHRRNPFETLVVTIISQNTADRNTDRAFGALTKHFQITAADLAKAPLREIEAAISPAGLQKAKAKAIKQASKCILDEYNGTLESVLSLPTEQARETLMQFLGVGPKTADVVMLFSGGHPTVPVDTHVNRLAKRLGFAAENAGYEEVRRSLQSLFDPGDYLAVHLLLIAHGRKTCHARRPLCSQCLVCGLCPSCGKWNQP